MKIFKIWQTVNNDYDTYDKAVVMAESLAEAKKIHPDGSYDYFEDVNEGRFAKADKSYGTWVKKKYVRAREIGNSKHNCEKGVIVASFHAG